MHGSIRPINRTSDGCEASIIKRIQDHDSLLVTKKVVNTDDDESDDDYDGLKAIEYNSYRR